MTSIDKFLAKTKKIRLLTYASRWMEINLSNKKATINMEYFGFDPPITTFKHVKFSTLNERSRICCCCTKKYIMLIRMVFKRNKQNILALGVRKHIPKRILKMYIRIHSRETGVMHMRKFSYINRITTKILSQLILTYIRFLCQFQRALYWKIGISYIIAYRCVIGNNEI